MKVQTKICIATSIISMIFNISMFLYANQDHIKINGYLSAFTHTNGEEFPPFWPPYWVIWNIIAVLFYVAAQGSFGIPDISFSAPMAPVIFFIIGSGLQTYLTAWVAMLAIRRLLRIWYFRKE